jgi:hypothetical protein
MIMVLRSLLQTFLLCTAQHDRFGVFYRYRCTRSVEPEEKTGRREVLPLLPVEFLY